MSDLKVRPPEEKARRCCQSTERELLEAGDDYGHVVGLFWGAGPFFGCGHQGLGYYSGFGGLHADGGFFHAADAEFLAVNVFGLDETVAVADENCACGNVELAFFIVVVFDYAEDHAALVEADGFAVANEERRQVAGVGVTQSARGAIVDRDKKRSEAVIAGVDDEMSVQAGYEFGRAEMLGAWR